MRSTLCFVVALLVWQGWEANGLEIFVTHSPFIIKGEAWFADIVLDSATETALTCQLSLTGSSGSSIYDTTAVISSGGTTGRAVFQIPSVVVDSSNANLNVACGKATLSSFITEVRNPASTAVVQTDRGKYQPGDKVYFRVLNIDKNLMPQNTESEVLVKDPAGTLIYKRTSTTEENEIGLMDDEFELSQDASLGDYIMTFRGGIEDKTAIITVEEYVLPKFIAKFEMDAMTVALQPDSDQVKLSGMLYGVYTSGQSVQGKAVLMVNGKTLVNVTELTGKFRVDIMLPIDAKIKGRQQLTVVAKVHEQYTDIEANVTQLFTVLPTPYTVRAVTPIPYFSQTDELYSLSVAMIDAISGENIPSGDLSNYVLYYEYKEGREMKTKTLRMVPGSDNPVALTLEVTNEMELSNDNFKVWLELNGVKSENVTIPVRKMTTNSGEYISVVMIPSTDENKACFEILPYRGDMYYQVAGNGFQYSMLKYTQVGGHCFTLTADHSPKYEVVGYQILTYTDGLNSQQEILVNRATGVYSMPRSDQVSMSLNRSPVEPGDSVVITVTTTATGTSLFGLRAVDTSSNLLAPGHSITLDKIERIRRIDALFESGRPEKGTGERPGPIPFMWFRPGPYEPTITPGSIISDAGLVLRNTNGLLFKQTDKMAGAAPDFDDNILEKVDETVTSDTSSTEDGEEEETREDFPETWLWELVQIVSTSAGQTTVDITREVPDTITTWVIDGFLLNPTAGLNTLNTKTLTVTKDVFTRMNLPYSIIRGEQFKLQIIVFNYKQTTMTVNVEFVGTNEFQIMNAAPRMKNLTIESGSSGLFEIPINASKIGEISLESVVRDVTRTTVLDREIQKLPVKPEGREVETSDGFTFELTEDIGTHLIDVMELVDKDNLVDGSLRMYVQVTGDTMGAYWKGIEKTEFRRPMGCGEQTIIYMTPSLFIGKYLKHTNKLDYEIEKKIEKNCRIGFLRELNYRHRDGSFSAFGEGSSDNPADGSTWLTAYVLKVFANLAEEGFAKDAMDLSILQEAFDYIESVKQTGESEYFEEKGKVVHSELVTGSGGDGTNPNAFTSFVIIALQDYYRFLKSMNKETKVKGLITDATAWLYSKGLDTVQSKYSKALMASALAKSGEILNKPEYITRAENYIDTVEIPRITTEEPDTVVPKVAAARSYRMVTKSTTIEEFGYHLLTMVTLSKVIASRKDHFTERAVKVTKWLQKQQTGNGYYKSTQDTAVVIQGSTEFAIANPESNSVDVTVKPNPSSPETIQLNNDNYYTLFTEQVDLTQLTSNNQLSLEIDGASGKAIITVVAMYNVKKGQVESTLNGTVTIKEDKDGHKFIACGVGSTQTVNRGMVICELTAQSGVAITRIMSDEGAVAYQKVEIDENKSKATIYFDGGEYQAGSAERKFNVYFEKTFEVTNPKNAIFTAEDYYNPADSHKGFYDAIGSNVTAEKPPTIGASSVTLNILLFSLALLFITLHNNISY